MTASGRRLTPLSTSTINDAWQSNSSDGIADEVLEVFEMSGITKSFVAYYYGSHQAR
jgi:hypothetical protein